MSDKEPNIFSNMLKWECSHCDYAHEDSSNVSEHEKTCVKDKKKEVINVGDMVRILSLPEGIEEYYNIGDICEVIRIDTSGFLEYCVYMVDKSDWWYFEKDEIEKV